MALDNKTTLASRPVKEIYAVSRLVREAKGVLEGTFPLLWVEGEISNLAMPASGHIYFTLKDEAAQVRCAMFKMRMRHIRFTPKNGMQVLLRVRVTLYEGRGEFQCVAEHMEEAGSGALQRAYEALKHRLGEEGLFDQAHKKQLPILPRRIGIVSSPDGAAVHDILSVLKRRYSAASIILYPVAVQGADSAKQLETAIKTADKRAECDVLIVSRGGGSLEDLWSFNDEKVTRAIYNCKLPVISAVGLPDPKVMIAHQSERVDSLKQQLQRNWSQVMTNKHQALDYWSVRLKDPQAKIESQRHHLSQLADRLQHQFEQKKAVQSRQLFKLEQRLQLTSPANYIQGQQQRLAQQQKLLHIAMKQRIDSCKSRLATQIRTLSAVSPLSTLERGYSITSQAETNAVVTDSHEVEVGQQLDVRLQQGQLRCDVIRIKHD